MSVTCYIKAEPSGMIKATIVKGATQDQIIERINAMDYTFFDDVYEKDEDNEFYEFEQSIEAYGIFWGPKLTAKGLDSILDINVTEENFNKVKINIRDEIIKDCESESDT